jgi:hypothetical protein
MKKVDAFYWFASVAIIGLLCWMSSEDLEAQIAAEDHAKHVQQIAQREAAEQKAEFEYLAKKAERMTGFAGVTSK